MPVGGAEVYAKWIPKNYTITFHVNGGNELAQDEQTKTVTYDQTYGTLPTAEKERICIYRLVYCGRKRNTYYRSITGNNGKRPYLICTLG